MSKIYAFIVSTVSALVVFLGAALIFNSAAGYAWGTEDAGIAVGIALMFWVILAPFYAEVSKLK